MGIRRPAGGAGRRCRRRVGMDREPLRALLRLRRGPLPGLLRALVRDPQGAARRQLRRARPAAAPRPEKLLHARAERYLRRVPQLRRGLNQAGGSWPKAMPSLPRDLTWYISASAADKACSASWVGSMKVTAPMLKVGRALSVRKAWYSASR